MLNDFWVKDNQIKDFVIENTSKGKKRTPGKWTRPDVTLVAVKAYAFTPQKILEVITFEIKRASVYDVSGVFETAAHSVFAHKSFLAVESLDEFKDSEEFDRLELLCKRFGIGLLLFTDVNDWETYEEVVDAERKIPDPYDINSFISTHFGKEKQNRILEMLR